MLEFNCSARLGPFLERSPRSVFIRSVTSPFSFEQSLTCLTNCGDTRTSHKGSKYDERQPTQPLSYLIRAATKYKYITYTQNLVLGDYHFVREREQARFKKSTEELAPRSPKAWLRQTGLAAALLIAQPSNSPVISNPHQ